jgi:hypothetical protein
VHADAAPRPREDVGEDAPRPERGDAAAQLGAAAQPLEHRGVGVRAEVVAVDARVHEPRQHLVVAGVRELERVRDDDAAPRVAVAEELPVARDDAPEEGEQLAPARVGGGAPEALAQRDRIAAHGARHAEEQRRVGAAEDLLPAEAVGDDEDDVARARRGGGGGLCERGVRDGEREGEDGQ